MGDPAFEGVRFSGRGHSLVMVLALWRYPEVGVVLRDRNLELGNWERFRAFLQYVKLETPE